MSIHSATPNEFEIHAIQAKEGDVRANNNGRAAGEISNGQI
jgi:hypothetical protein